MYEYPHILQILVQAFVLLGGGLGYLRLRAPDLLKQLLVTPEFRRRPWYHLTECKSITIVVFEHSVLLYICTFIYCLILLHELLGPGLDVVSLHGPRHKRPAHLSQRRPHRVGAESK